MRETKLLQEGLRTASEKGDHIISSGVRGEKSGGEINTTIRKGLLVISIRVVEEAKRTSIRRNLRDGDSERLQGREVLCIRYRRPEEKQLAESDSVETTSRRDNPHHQSRQERGAHLGNGIETIKHGCDVKPDKY